MWIPNLYLRYGFNLFRCLNKDKNSILGRFTGFGAAINYRSVPLFFASVADLILITLFNYFVEQPFVKRMYGGTSSSVLA